MNLYFLVEGRSTERKVYRAWLKSAFPGLREVQTRDEMDGDTFYLVSTEGLSQHPRSHRRGGR